MRTSIPILFLALVLALAGCQDQGIMIPVDDPDLVVTPRPAAALPATALHRVAGGGTVVREDLEGAPTESYGFQAQLDVTGRVSGQTEVHFPASGLRMQIDVRCLAVQGHQAWLSGRVTRSDRPDVPTGTVFLWQVEDNGEGHDGSPDRISNFIHGSFGPQVCRWKPELTTYAWDNGVARVTILGGLGLDDLVGTWDATSFLYVDFRTLADTLDVLSDDRRARWTVAPDGHFTMIWWVPGEIVENVAGTLAVVDGQVVLSFESEDPAIVLTQSARRIGLSLYSYGDQPVGHDWDGDEEEDPSRVIGQWDLKRTGALIDDLAGTWSATLWRYTSTGDPSVTVDVVGQGVQVTMMVGLDSYYTVVWDPGPTNSGDLLVDGDQLLARNGESVALSYTLTGTTLAFSGGVLYDFGGGTPEPAWLEASLVRQ